MPVGEQIGTLLVEAIVEVGVDERMPAAGESLGRGVENGEAGELTPEGASGFVEDDGGEVPEGRG